MPPSSLSKKILEFGSLSLIFVLILIALILFFVPSTSAVGNGYFDIEKGEGLSQIAALLVERGYMNNSAPFKICSFLLGAGKRSQAGVYQIEKPLGACQLAYRISNGIYSTTPVKLTIPEGFLKKEIAAKFADFPRFDQEKFLGLAPEGYLFPDTYFFNPSMTETDVIEIMKNNFEKQMAPLQNDIKKSKRSLREIIIVASIVERETVFAEDRPKVAEVLWRRLDLGMPLQADATFAYINGKGTFQLTDDDLKINSPYNTYTRVGLPPTAIGNPGLASIKAALYPAKTDYLYFLSDKTGRVYFAKTFEEHQTNRERYLGK